MSKMDCITGCLIFLGAICAYQVSGQGAPTADEKIVGSAIANKLNELMRPKITRPNLFSMLKSSASGRVSGPQIVQTQYLDFQLLLDSSGSIGSRNFDEAKVATNVIVDFINGKAAIRPGGSRVSLIEFSSPTLTKLVFGLGDRPYAWNVKQEIQKVKYDNGPSTATAIALSKAKTEFQQNPKYGNAKVVWILTDGRSNTGGNPVVSANELKSMGVTICAVTIGNNINMNEIDAISSSDCVFKAKSYVSYSRIMSYALKSGGGALSPVLDPGFFSGIRFNAK